MNVPCVCLNPPWDTFEGCNFHIHRIKRFCPFQNSWSSFRLDVRHLWTSIFNFFHILSFVAGLTGWFCNLNMLWSKGLRSSACMFSSVFRWEVEGHPISYPLVPLTAVLPSPCVKPNTAFHQSLLTLALPSLCFTVGVVRSLWCEEVFYHKYHFACSSVLYRLPHVFCVASVRLVQNCT